MIWLRHPPIKLYRARAPMTSLPLVTSDRSLAGASSFQCFLNRSSFLPTSNTRDNSVFARPVGTSLGALSLSGWLSFSIAPMKVRFLLQFFFCKMQRYLCKDFFVFAAIDGLSQGAFVC